MPSTMPKATASANPASVVQRVTKEFLRSGDQYLTAASKICEGAGRTKVSTLKMRQASSHSTNRPMVNSQGDSLSSVVLMLISKLVSRAQRSAQRSVAVRCRPGTLLVRGGPGSALHRFALHRVRDTAVERSGSCLPHLGD